MMAYRLAPVLVGTVLLLLASSSPQLSTRGVDRPPIPLAMDDQSSTDRFWERFTAFEAGPALKHDYASLQDMTSAVDLALRGHIVDLYIGEERRLNEVEPPVRLLYVTVAVDEVLKGVPIMRNPGNVEVMFYPVGDDFDVAAYRPPSDEYFWFLNHEPTQRVAAGRSQINAEIAPFAYFRPNFHQTVLRNHNGTIDVILADEVRREYGVSAFPLGPMGVEGMNAAELAANVVEIASIAGSP